MAIRILISPMKKILLAIIFLLQLLALDGCGGGGSGSSTASSASSQPSSSKAITAFSLSGTSGVIVEPSKTISVTMPFGTDLTALVATYTTTGSSVKVGTVTQSSGTIANNFTNPVSYTVTAADGTTSIYTVTVTVALNPAKAITSFSLPGYPGAINETNKTISINVPYGTNLTSQTACFTSTGASVSVNGTIQNTCLTTNDFSNPIIYTVTAADGTTANYTVTVTVATYAAKSITAYSLPGVMGTVNQNNKTITVTMPYGTDITSLIATFAATGVSVKVGAVPQISRTTANDFTNPVVYSVTGADNLTVNYTVTVYVSGDVPTGQIPDTGITSNQCFQAGGDSLLSCTSSDAIALNDKQDGMIGLDVTSPNNNDGKLGFSYSAIAGGCVKDNITGLTWEVKTNDGGLRDLAKTYTNYGDGSANEASQLVAAVNALGLCGYSDWRLPSADELQTLVDYGVSGLTVTIDSTWFINTQSGSYWSSTTNVGNDYVALVVDFNKGAVSFDNRGSYNYVRLVR